MTDPRRIPAPARLVAVVAACLVAVVVGASDASAQTARPCECTKPACAPYC